MKGRILKTFIGYAVIIIIPVGILIYQGIQSLNNHKTQMINNLQSKLEKVGADLYQEMLLQWQDFIEAEKVRPFYHYQPLIIPDEEQISIRGIAVQRSPLYQYVHDLSRLDPASSGATTSQRTVFNDSLIGWFQLDPLEGNVVTPYDPNTTFETGESEYNAIIQYRRFLNDEVMPAVLDMLNLNAVTSPTTGDILFQVKTKRITKVREPRDKMKRMEDLSGSNLDFSNGEGPLVSVGYYDFTHLTVEHGGNDYIVVFRPILIESRKVLLQGFVFSQLLFVTETQSFLEPKQPEFGSVVIGDFAAVQGRPFFPPFSGVAVGKRTGDQSTYLAAYYAERNRFLVTILLLITALGGSLLHLGKLIVAQSKLTRKKNDFISAVTHELKAPLTSIIMYTEMLLEGWAQGKEGTYYKYIHCESERLSRLIKNVLDYSGIERGVFRLKQGSLYLHDFVEETLEPLHLWIENNGLELVFEVSANPLINFDKDALSQVVYNLCDNAIKYGKAPENPKLTIRIEEREDEAFLIVFDNGPGVSQEERERVFQRFYRCENELTRESTGTGLGLSLVKELVEGNGGSLELFDPPTGHGFGVKITLIKAGIDEEEPEFA